MEKLVSNLVLEPCLIEGHEFKPHCTFISLFIELRASPKEVVCDMFSYGPACLSLHVWVWDRTWGEGVGEYDIYALGAQILAV